MSKGVVFNCDNGGKRREIEIFPLGENYVVTVITGDNEAIEVVLSPKDCATIGRFLIFYAKVKGEI